MYALSAIAAPVALSPATVAAIAAIKAEPCWSQDLHNCVDTTGPSAISNCAAIRAGYASKNAADKAAMDAAVEAVPFCPAPTSDWMMWAGAGAIGLALGMLIGSFRK